jgi:hypothetical protein
MNAYLRRRPLKCIGFGGKSFQVYDAFHPRDLVPLLSKQFDCRSSAENRVFNFGGGCPRHSPGCNSDASAANDSAKIKSRPTLCAPL